MSEGEELRPAEKKVVPYLRGEEAGSACDYCGEKGQKYEFDIRAPSRTLYVCGKKACQDGFKISRADFLSEEGRVGFESVHAVVPSLFDSSRQWKVVRGNGEVESGWHVPVNWRVRTKESNFVRERGEPWWRIPLVKQNLTRLCLLSELRNINPDALASDVWDMLLNDVLPKAAEEPNDLFLQHYPASLWTESISDSELKMYRIDL
jgi:hypothetical protein